MKDLNADTLKVLIKELDASECLPEGFKVDLYQEHHNRDSFCVGLSKHIKFDLYKHPDDLNMYILNTLLDEVIKPLNVGGLKREIEELKEQLENSKKEVEDLQKFKQYYEMQLVMNHGKNV